MKVKEEKTPATQGIITALNKVDFKDTFSTTNHSDDLQKIAHLIFGTFPKWVSFLMRFRNTLVKPFGLKVEMPKDYKVDYKEGSYTGFFKIYKIMDNELILGADDKHLNFRASLYDSKEKEFNVKLSTLVEYNNGFGKFYMGIVKPFHRIVIKSMLKRAHKTL